MPTPPLLRALLCLARFLGRRRETRSTTETAGPACESRTRRSSSSVQPDHVGAGPPALLCSPRTRSVGGVARCGRGPQKRRLPSVAQLLAGEADEHGFEARFGDRELDDVEAGCLSTVDDQRKNSARALDAEFEPSVDLPRARTSIDPF